jgi:mannose-6-phosphate isomerase class I
VLLVVDGTITLKSGDGTLTLGRGEAAFLRADEVVAYHGGGTSFLTASGVR